VAVPEFAQKIAPPYPDPAVADTLLFVNEQRVNDKLPEFIQIAPPSASLLTLSVTELEEKKYLL